MEYLKVFQGLAVSSWSLLIFPLIFILVASVYYIQVDSSKTVAKLGSFFYPILLGGIYYLILGTPGWPPLGFYTFCPYIIAAMALFIIIPFFQKWIEVVILNGLVYVAFLTYTSQPFLVLIGARVVITLAFIILFTVALKPHFLLTKLLHSFGLVALVYFALKFGQHQIANLALLCSVSVFSGVILKILFWSKTAPNFSRPLIDLGLPLLLAWLLIDQAEILNINFGLSDKLNPLNYIDPF